MSNELSGRTFPCTGSNLIPSGGEYNNLAYASCAGVPGSDGTNISGDAYLETLSYSKSDIWRNFGILWAWWALFVALTAYFTTFKASGAASNSYITFVRNKHTGARMNAKVRDAESGPLSPVNSDVAMLPNETVQDRSNDKPSLIRNTSVITWRNLKYTVKVPGGERLLLDNINGYVKPGQLGALMGSSGAGKTTLLDVLAQRKTEGRIEGQIHVDGRPLPLSFQRSAGYCEQLDVHEPFATVREALEFSAILRQPRGTPKSEKLAYVDTIIDLLEMRDIEHALIGIPGSGLGVEQCKRLTIGVELVAKPSILIFLDEPTSGEATAGQEKIIR
jgi:ABC-type Mn2+/Zn2+ transport system ATPase subunit